MQQALAFYGINKHEITSIFPEFKLLLKHKPVEISGGQLRLFEVMLILKSKHLFCLLDEPFSGIMPVHVELLNKVLIETKKVKGIILTDHLYQNTMQVADHLYLLANGKTYLIKDREELIFRGYLNA